MMETTYQIKDGTSGIKMPNKYGKCLFSKW